MDVLVLDGKTASEESEGQGPLYQSNEEGGGTSSGEGDQDHGSHRRPLQGQEDVQALTQEEYLQYHMQKNAEMIERMQQMQRDESRDSQQMVQENLWR
jgi:hypothetical protein